MPPKNQNKKKGGKKGGKSSTRSSTKTAAEDFATPVSPNAGQTKTITVSGKQFSVKWLDNQTEIVRGKGTVTNPHKFERFSNKKGYLCSAKKAFGVCICNMYFPAFGNRKFCVKEEKDEEGDDAKSVEVWLCANCQQYCGLLEEEEERTLVPQTCNYARVPLTTGDNKTDAFLCKGSCVDFALELSSKFHLIVRVEDPPTAEEMANEDRMKILFGVRREGHRRGSKHLSCSTGSYEAVFKTLMECPNVAKVWGKTFDADGSKFYYVISVLYQEGHRSSEHVSFVPHVDVEYLGKPHARSNWTIYTKKLEDGAIGKVMRFQDRQTGWWFDINCTHGTIVEQSKYASGIHVKDEKGMLVRSPISHAVFNGKDTCTLTWDHGKKCDGTKRAFTTAEIEAAFQINDDAKDDGESSDDDSEYTDDEGNKKPAAT